MVTLSMILTFKKKKIFFSYMGGTPKLRFFKYLEIGRFTKLYTKVHKKCKGYLNCIFTDYLAVQPLHPRWYGALLEDLLVSIKNTIALSCTPPLFFCLLCTLGAVSAKRRKKVVFYRLKVMF